MAGRTPAGQTTGTWGTSEDQTSISHDTQPPPVSLTSLSIYNNLMLHTVLALTPVFSRLPPFFALTVNAADPECTHI